MKRFTAQWFVVFVLAGGTAYWITEGRALARRTFFAAPEIAPYARRESRFVALLFPRITPGPGRFSMSKADLDATLASLRKDGYVSIGLQDVRALYSGRTLLPAKAVLLAFDQDYPESIELADAAMARSRMRGVVFLSHIAAMNDVSQRRYLSSHAVNQLLKEAMWDIGWGSRSEPAPTPELPLVAAALGDGPEAPLRFKASETGLNDAGDDPKDLHILALAAGAPADAALRAVARAWPRKEAFSDDFSGERLGEDWVNGWGGVSAAHHRLVLLATPRTTGASVFLRGSEKWRDTILEFVLQRSKSEFWAYARYRDDGRYVRFGTRDGYWYVEEKVGRRSQPTMLARAPIAENRLPAKVRFVLKDDWAIAHVDGRMLFGRALHVHTRIKDGGVMFGVYDARPRAALAVLTSVRAAPGDGKWIALSNENSVEASLDNLREEAASAYAISPGWISIEADGGVWLAAPQKDLVSSMAGFYRCQLVPSAEFADVALLADAGRAERLRWGLRGAAAQLQAKGLNLRMRGAWTDRPATLRFLARLREDLHAAKRVLWVTVDEPESADPALRQAVDGILGPASKTVAGLEMLQVAGAGEPILTSGGPI